MGGSPSARFQGRLTNVIITLIVCAALWETAAVLSGGVGLVSLSTVIPALGGIVAAASFWKSIAITVGLTLLGLAAGTGVALIVGIPIGMSKFLDASARGTFNFIRAIPTVVLLPLLLASLGSRTSVVIILVVLGVSLKMVVYVTRGTRDISSSLDDQTQLFHLSRLTQTVAIRIPAASAIVITGLRQSVNRAYGAVILAGFLAGTAGLGRDISLANMRGDDAVLLAYVVVSGIVSVFLYQLFILGERKVVRWRVVA